MRPGGAAAATRRSGPPPTSPNGWRSSGPPTPSDSGRAPQGEDGNRPDACGLDLVPREARVPGGLLAVDAIALLAGDLLDRHLEGLRAHLHRAGAGGGEVVVPGGMGLGSGRRGEDVDDGRVVRVAEVHHRGHALLARLAADVMQQRHRSAGEVAADLPTV